MFGSERQGESGSYFCFSLQPSTSHLATPSPTSMTLVPYFSCPSPLSSAYFSAFPNFNVEVERELNRPVGARIEKWDGSWSPFQGNIHLLYRPSHTASHTMLWFKMWDHLLERPDSTGYTCSNFGIRWTGFKSYFHQLLTV